MSIKQQVSDAIFLIENERYLGALSVLMLAIAASSRKKFPKGSQSIINPIGKNKKKIEMTDGEAFIAFLGGRINAILFSNDDGNDMVIPRLIDKNVPLSNGNISTGGILTSFKGKSYDLIYILYKFYRCELVHNGELPEDIEFIPDEKEISISNGVGISFSITDKISVSYSLIYLLIKAVTDARCNSMIFDKQFYDLTPKSQNIDNIIADRYAISLGRVEILKIAVKHFKINKIDCSNNDKVIEAFKKLINLNIVNGGAITGLSSAGLYDQKVENLTCIGLDIIKEIDSNYSLNKVF